MNKLKILLGFGPKVNYKELFANGAQIIDVRTKAEFDSGNIPGSKNIPLQVLGTQLAKLDKNKPVITCCASGMRSATAKGILKSNGFKEVHNGGGWTSLLSKLTR
jgi:rhodanese-related sulfurtransferase